IARLLDPDVMAGLEKDTSGDGQGLLRAAHDHDVVGLATYGGVGPEVGGGRLPEGAMAHRVAVVEQPGQRVAGVAREETRPDRDREALDGGLAHAERPPAPEPRLGRTQPNSRAAGEEAARAAPASRRAVGVRRGRRAPPGGARPPPRRAGAPPGLAKDPRPP